MASLNSYSSSGAPSTKERRMPACNWGLFKWVVVGQFLALLLTGTATFSGLLVKKHVDAPTFQSTANYFFLSFFLLKVVIRREPLRIPWWKYAIVALLDVEGNYCLVQAYQHTSTVSVQLLDCFTIPCVMVLAYCVLQARYSRFHFAACVLCLIGMGLLVYTDTSTQSSSSDSDGGKKWSEILEGDGLVLLGCVFYSLSNISQEYIVKSFDRSEYLGMLGLCGFIIGGVQTVVVEREAVAAIDWGDSMVIAYLGAFTLCLFLFYSITPILMESRSAVFFNLSVLTADFWTIIVASTLFSYQFQPTYFIAAAVIIGGLICYNAADIFIPSTPPKSETRLLREPSAGFVDVYVDVTVGESDGEPSPHHKPHLTETLPLL